MRLQWGHGLFDLSCVLGWTSPVGVTEVDSKETNYVLIFWLLGARNGKQNSWCWEEWVVLRVMSSVWLCPQTVQQICRLQGTWGTRRAHGVGLFCGFRRPGLRQKIPPSPDLAAENSPRTPCHASNWAALETLGCHYHPLCRWNQGQVHTLPLL